MPNCFTLTVKGEPRPSTLNDIDGCMCAYFGVVPDDKRYYQQWVDIEGFALAMGKDWAWMRERMPDRVAIINWLDANYTPDAFVTVGR